MEKIRTLIVDDHKLIQNGLKAIIDTVHNISVVKSCNNGEEAITYLKNNAHKIDVVLMDITMPKMNGIESTEIITKLHPSIAVLALTMHSDEAYIMKMINAGALGYILKDSEREKLVDAIKTVYRKEKYYSNEVSLKLINILLNKNKIADSDAELSKREIQIIQLITDGISKKEVAKKLSISVRTIETHRHNIYKKLQIKNTAELVRYALSKKIVI